MSTIHIQTGNNTKPVGVEAGDIAIYKDGRIAAVNNKKDLVPQATKAEVDAAQNTANAVGIIANAAIPKSKINYGDISQVGGDTVPSSFLTNWVWHQAVAAQNTANAAVPKAGGTITGALQFHHGGVCKFFMEQTATGMNIHAYNSAGAWAGYYMQFVNDTVRIIMNHLECNTLRASGAVSALNGQIAMDYANHGGGVAGGRLVSHTGFLLLQANNGQILSVSHFVPSSHSTYNLGRSDLRWGNLYMINHPNVSCDSKGKVLIANVNFSGAKPKGRSAIASIPIEDLRSIIRELAIREYHRYKSVIDEKAPPQIITSVGENGEETTEEIPVYKEIIDTEHKELGIFIDDLKDNKYFDLFGRVSTDEETGEKSYSMDTGSYATLALAGAKDALNRLDALEVKAKKYDGLCDLLVSKGILTKEEIQSL